MRTGMVISVVLLVTVLVCGWAAEEYVTRWTIIWVGAAEEISILTEKSAWQRAEETLAAYQARFDMEQRRIKSFVRHAPVQEIGLAMERLMLGIRRQDTELCALSCVEMRQNALLLQEQETLSLTNLL